MLAIISMASLGILLALVLAIASRRFYVKTDSRVDLVLEALPGQTAVAVDMPAVLPTQKRWFSRALTPLCALPVALPREWPLPIYWGLRSTTPVREVCRTVTASKKMLKP